MREPNEVERAVMTEVCQAVGCEVAEALSKSRRPDLVDARGMFAVLMSDRGVSTYRIAESLGCTRATVLHLFRRHLDLMDVDRRYRANYVNARALAESVARNAERHISPIER